MEPLKRPRVELEERLVSEWVAENYPEERYVLRARLGPFPEEARRLQSLGLSARLYDGVRHWADCIVLTGESTLLIEAKVRLNPAALGQLITYREEFYRTQEWRHRWTLPLRLIALYAYAKPEDLEIFDKYGIECVEYRPRWIQEAFIRRVRWRG